MARRNFNDRWASGGAQTDPGGVKTALGWIAEKPAYQFFNWIMGRADEMLQYLERRGVAQWDAATPYETNGLCVGSDGVLYQAVAGSTNVNPVGTVVAPTWATGSWKRVTPPATESASGLIELATTGEVAALSDAVRAVTPAGLGALAASLTQRGIVELATGAEAAALSDATRAVTPSALASVLASATAVGLVELATSAEVIAGTDASRAVTPQALGALTQSLANPGYKQFPGGLILQWGRNNIASGTDSFDVSLPIAFPTAALIALGSGKYDTGETGETGTAWVHPSTPLTHVRLGIGSGPAPGEVSWLVIGH